MWVACLQQEWIRLTLQHLFKIVKTCCFPLQVLYHLFILLLLFSPRSLLDPLIVFHLPFLTFLQFCCHAFCCQHKIMSIEQLLDKDALNLWWVGAWEQTLDEVLILPPNSHLPLHLTVALEPHKVPSLHVQAISQRTSALLTTFHGHPVKSLL